jgi:hypothetical protein
MIEMSSDGRSIQGMRHLEMLGSRSLAKLWSCQLEWLRWGLTL